MNPFVTFMSSTAGRIVRLVVGLALVGWGLLSLGGTVGLAVAIVGAVPLLAGIFDVCLFAPLLSCPLGGAKVRAAK